MENVPKQLVGNDREKYWTLFCFFKVKAGLILKSASGLPQQSLLISAEGGVEEAAMVAPTLWKRMVLWCSPTAC